MMPSSKHLARREGPRPTQTVGPRRAMPGSDFLHLDPSQATPRDLAGWLTAAIRDAIADRLLSPGARLLATGRSRRPGVSRGVVVEAIAGWAMRAWSAAGAAAGTIVRELGMGRATSARTDAAIPAPDPTPDPAAARRSDRTGLTTCTGLPDLVAFPRTTWLRAETSVLAAATAADARLRRPARQRAAAHELSALAGPDPWLPARTGTKLVVVAGVAGARHCSRRCCGRRGVTRDRRGGPGLARCPRPLACWGLRHGRHAGRRRGHRVDTILGHRLVPPW